MGDRTGKPRGRPPGARNRKTLETEQATVEAAAIISEVIPNAFDGDAHALLMTVYKDPLKEWPLRVDAAKAAIRYEKPALASAQLTAEVNATVRQIERTIVDPPHTDS
jgi:hypothetical protein